MRKEVLNGRDLPAAVTASQTSSKLGLTSSVELETNKRRNIKEMR